MQTVDDKEIIALYLLPGDQERAMRLLIDKYQRRLYHHIRHMVTDHDETDDILQEVFIKVWNGLATFRQEAQLFTWLYRIATNECLSHLRKRKYQHVPVEEVSYQLSGNDDASAAAQSGEQIQQKLQAALTQLPEKQRLVFQMKYFDEMTYEDMSEILGTSVGALKASYHHAVKKIELFLTND
ncbi:MAG: sigma-70 family RNA polymerase sigma factor [Flavobacteriales bacterium]|nr:sigma-70 family RNA polymerase sigma factor [Flavobacteriales bacterium]